MYLHISTTVKLNGSVVCKAAEDIDFEWKKFFSPEELDRLARNCNFSKRNSKQNKLSGATFFDLIVMNNDLLCSQSLNGLCSQLSLKHNIDLTPQSLNSRFNAAAVTFFKCVLQHVIQSQFGTTFKTIKTPFNRFLVKDSTCFQVSPDLVTIYPGSGGSGSKASIRIQFEYDLLSGAIVDLSVNAFNDQDAKNSTKTLDCIKSNDLIIRDLAYMHTDVFKGIGLRKAWYLCRLGHNVSVYERISSVSVEMLDFKELYSYMKSNDITTLEKTVLISEEKIPTRLFIYLLPEHIVEERIRKKNAESKKKGRNAPTEEYLIRQHFNLIITNATEDKITIDTAYEIYRQRWQIELIFKSWKSIGAIDRVKKVNRYRLECFLFAKLIMLMMGWKIYWRFNIVCYDTFECTLSQFKFFQIFKNLIELLSSIFRSGTSIDRLTFKINKILDTLRLNEKKDKCSSTEMIKLLLGSK